jgi:hypothetical protein
VVRKIPSGPCPSPNSIAAQCNPCYKTSLYVIDFKCALNFGEGHLTCGSPKFHRRRGALRISNIQFETDRREVKQVKVCNIVTCPVAAGEIAIRQPTRAMSVDAEIVENPRSMKGAKRTKVERRRHHLRFQNFPATKSFRTLAFADPRIIRPSVGILREPFLSASRVIRWLRGAGVR